MAKYTILVIGLLLKSNKLANSGDVVEEEKLPDTGTKLEKDGYVRKSTASDIKTYKEKLEKEESKRQATATKSVKPETTLATTAETPVVETPVVETPVVETPVVETPVIEDENSFGLKLIEDAKNNLKVK